MRPVSFYQFCTDPNLAGPKPDSWEQSWGVVARVIDRSPLTPEQLAVFCAATGRTKYLRKAINTLLLLIGRRGGKSHFAAHFLVYLSLCVEYPKRALGEVIVNALVGVDRKQGRIVLSYLLAIIEANPMFRAMVESVTSDSVTLTNGVRVEIGTASYRTIRGYTLGALLIDEAAFLRSDDSANPLREVVAAGRPGLATTGGPLIMLTSPHQRSGLVYELFQRHHGADESDTLVWRATSREMNPTIPESVIRSAFQDDPARAAAEWEAEFRQDLEAFVPVEVVQDATPFGVRELPASSGIDYVAFVDAAGGSGTDSMTLGIAHREGELAVLDLVREVRPPFSPERVVEEFAEDLARYGCRSVIGDRYAALWPRERFERCGIGYEASELTKSQIYLEGLPMLMSGQLRLLDNKRLLSQLTALERRTSRTGRDFVDHGPGGHDDVCNAGLGALVFAGEFQRAKLYQGEVLGV